MTNDSVVVSTPPVQIDPSSIADEKVKISANDTTAEFLDTKLVAGSNVTLTEINDGMNERLIIASTGGGGLSNGDDEIIVEFDYTDTLPVSIATLIANATIVRTRITIDTSFDGAVSLSVGVGGNTGILLDTNENDPFSLGSYENWPDQFLPLGTDIHLYGSISGATQGLGRVTIKVVG